MSRDVTKSDVFAGLVKNVMSWVCTSHKKIVLVSGVSAAHPNLTLIALTNRASATMKTSLFIQNRINLHFSKLAKTRTKTKRSVAQWVRR